MQPDAEGKYPYTGSLDCTMKTLKSGGPFKFYTGFPVYCVRIAPHVMVLVSICLSISLSLSLISCEWIHVVTLHRHRRACHMLGSELIA